MDHLSKSAAVCQIDVGARARLLLANATSKVSQVRAK